jgi:hypothetical protein
VSLRSGSHESQDHFGLLVLLLIGVIFVTGLSDKGWVRVAAATLNLAALGAGFVHIQSYRRLSMIAVPIGGVIGAVLVASYSVTHAATAIGATLQVIVLGVLTLAVTSTVLQHPRVTNQTLLGATSAYLLLGQVFAWIYMALPGYADESVLDPTQQGEIPIYYSYVVLTTLGFGDIEPVGALAQRVTVFEALLGQLFLAILLARLVSLYARNDTARPPFDQGGPAG